MNEKILAKTPPMGWNSWNTFYDQINEDLIKTTADAMIESGLKNAGYEYLIIDDCWSDKQRTPEGKLAPDPVKFPNGIKAVADYVHSKGLKFGIYSCCGVRTCANYPGSFEHEYSDAMQFAEWGVDYLKYDNGYRPNSIATPILYRRMSMALRNCGRDILLAACQWGSDDVHRWIRSSGAHTFRSTIDIRDSWDSISDIALSQIDNQCINGPGCFNDMDMLVVGMDGKGYNPETTSSGCSEDEYVTHFALWAIMGSPLIIGCDIRNLSDSAKNILTNKELIRINQDITARGCYKLNAYAQENAFVLVKLLENNEFALGFFNFDDKEVGVSIDFWDIGIGNNKSVEFTDCMNPDTREIHRECFVPLVKPHGCKVYRCKIVA